jgi:hypothetical protein
MLKRRDSIVLSLLVTIVGLAPTQEAAAHDRFGGP